MARIFTGETSSYHSVLSKSLSRWYSAWTHRRLVVQFLPLTSISVILVAELLLVLRKFGKCNIKWPKNDGVNHNIPGPMNFSFKTLFIFQYRLLSCCLSRIEISMWTSQTLHSTTTTLDHRLFPAHSPFAYNHHSVGCIDANKSNQTSLYHHFLLSLSEFNNPISLDSNCTMEYER